MDKEDLIELVEYLYNQEDTRDHIPSGFSTESSYKDALLSGYIDKDMEFSIVTPGLSNITVDKEIRLNGDLVKITPVGRRLELYCQGNRYYKD